MNDHKFEDLKVGMKASFERELKAADLDAFTALSGDHSPIHVDTAYAKAQGFQDRVAHGLLSSSFYSTLVGVYLPGKRALLRDIKIEFLAPVFAGDRLIIEGEVVEIHEEFRVIEIKASISNSKGVRISRAKIKVGLRET